MQRGSWRTASLRRRVYEILERGAAGDRASLLVDRLLIVLIVINLAAVALESMPEIDAQYGLWFDAIETVSLVVFSAEYVLRVWAAAEHSAFSGVSVARARWGYVRSASGLVDLLAVLPFWLGYFLPGELKVFQVLRIIRFLKIARYSPAIRSLLDVLYDERRALFGCSVILTGVALISASLMHPAEGHAQPDRFGTIPDALWWAIVTLGTIGYGDAVPMTLLGKLVASVTIFFGLIMIALPVGIIASAFAEQIHRRDFVVTWAMVARVPLFSGLSASEVAEIMRLLRSTQTRSRGRKVDLRRRRGRAHTAERWWRKSTSPRWPPLAAGAFFAPKPGTPHQGFAIKSRTLRRLLLAELLRDQIAIRRENLVSKPITDHAVDAFREPLIAAQERVEIVAASGVPPTMIFRFGQDSVRWVASATASPSAVAWQGVDLIHNQPNAVGSCAARRRGQP
jgi:voltage-gated potassium channel